MSEYIDGRRWPAETPPGTPEDAPAGSETPSTAPDQQTRPAALEDFPGFDVYPGYAMHADSVALHFPVTAVPALAALFPTEADALHAAALDVEQEAESEQDRRRGRQLTGGGA